MTVFEFVQSVASVATAVGVGIAAWQLRMAKEQDQAKFEESLRAQYRGVADRLPLGALLGQALDEGELEAHLRAFYDYFELSNTQAFLARRGRLRKETWTNFRCGIDRHLAGKAFQQAWRRLASDVEGNFDSLRSLLPGELLKPDNLSKP